MEIKAFIWVFSLLLLLLTPQQIFGKTILYGGGEEEDDGQGVNKLKRSMFPDDFIFGVATSAYQIEGGYLEDGKGVSNWDVFASVPGNIHNGDNAYIANDHYHRYMEDIENLQYLGVDAYRLSISWARILPKGKFGDVNPSGIMFYNTIIDSLLHKGIEPFVSLNHLDIPQELEERYESWLSPLIQEDFVHLAKTCFENFGDRVKYWMTINEPNVYANMGYNRGVFSPGHCSAPYGNCSVGNSELEPLIVAHNMLLSHAKAAKVYREQFQAKQSGLIGIPISAVNFEPFEDNEFHNQAAERALTYYIGWMLDPLIYGDYPSIMRKYLGNILPKFSEDEVKLIKGSVDFIGINHYSSLYAIDCFHYSANCTATDNNPSRGFVQITGYRDGIPIGDEMDHGKYFVVPDGMEKIADYISERYPNMSIYITENGYTPEAQDMLLDLKRVDYHETYLAALAKSIRKGAKVKGYFIWSLMDSFEWEQGYDSPFGLYHVDRRTLRRAPKLSAMWYSNFLANKSNGESIIHSSLLTKLHLIE